MKIYVSASFHDRDYAEFASDVLQELGHTITYRWAQADYNITHGEGLSAEENLTQRRLLASCEINAVVSADAVVQIGLLATGWKYGSEGVHLLKIEEIARKALDASSDQMELP